jgi:hypothetical protein
MSIKITEDEVIKSTIHFSIGDVGIVILVFWLIVFSAMSLAIIVTRYIMW